MNFLFRYKRGYSPILVGIRARRLSSPILREPAVIEPTNFANHPQELTKNDKRTHVFFLIIAFCWFFQGSIGCAQESTSLYNLNYVIIDHKEKAYTVYMGIPENLPPEDFEKIKSDVSKEEGVDMVSWYEFKQNPDKYIKSKIIIYDYQDSQIVKGIVKIIEKSPGIPIGLTWNGGIAITYNDYQYAKNRYQQYLVNPAKYKPERDPRADPISPKRHFRRHLGW